ncbi:MAG: hypothetical protein ROZ64_18220 [Burkholderiaceae bacterium]|jgi:hypothetical protein|nr:hypothetical protein [Burkholderiaceae bacterium]
MKPLLCAVAVVVLAASGCVAIEDKFYPGLKANVEGPTVSRPSAIPDGHGRVWVYRLAPKGPGVPVVAGFDGGYYFYVVPRPSRWVDLPPGRHLLHLDNGNRLEFDLRAGEEVFVRFDVDPKLFGKGIHPVLVDLSFGRREFKAHSGIDTEAVASEK